MSINQLEIYYKQLNEIRRKREKLQFALIYRHNLVGTKGNSWQALNWLQNYIAYSNYDRYLKKEGRLERKISELSLKRK